ncbi:hypothetical protein HMPREF0880_02958 [Yokenella regensburgei ATCC 43003]|jgi:hypothetical protein|nr:hypothetical protein HMPREF0880_02958 [Yokenella regensburgei ATCC 43003]
MPTSLNVNRRQPVQRKVNLSDCDYHYRKKKRKRYVSRMMTGCKKLAGEGIGGFRRIA